MGSSPTLGTNKKAQHARNAHDLVAKRVALHDGESGIRLKRRVERERTYVRGDVAKWLRQGFAKPLFGGSIPPVASNNNGALRSERRSLGGASGSVGTQQSFASAFARSRDALASCDKLDQSKPCLNTRSSTFR